jgi:MFS family permease
LSRIRNNGVVLIGGAVCFFFVAFPFVVQPDATMWNLTGLLMIYTLHGVGRATFESTLKATFIDFFPTETAGAFSNIILQSGLASAVGYFLTFRLRCEKLSTFCIEYSDETLHNLLSFEILVCITAVAAILGYWRASSIHKVEVEKAKIIPDVQI